MKPKESKESVLIIAPHPDDEVLGCGGTIARYTSSGNDVSVLIVTRGIPNIFPVDEIEETRLELRKAHSLLGISETVFLDFPAPTLDVVPKHQIADAIRRVVVDFRPQVVFFPHYGDLHADHKAVHYATLVATRPVGDNPVRRLLCYETLSETDWGMPSSSEAFIPNVFVDITQYLDVKLRAMACYESQLGQGPCSRSLKTLKSLAHLRGATANLEAAEAFMLIREISL
jgi:LmbE family N-acetylglucosaminyl deacetylase